MWTPIRPIRMLGVDRDQTALLAPLVVFVIVGSRRSGEHGEDFDNIKRSRD
jgi:hypothetical protein